MTNPNQQIVIDAWNMLWNKQKHPNYYLPDVILNGIKENGITVDLLRNLDIEKMGPYTLFDKNPWGSISLEFTSNIVNGLNTMFNNGITVATDGLSFAATVGVSELNCEGHFNVLASGLSMCAIDSVWAISEMIPPFNTMEAGSSNPNPDDSPGIQAAKSYREKLLAQGEHGQFLVGTYYDNNEVYNQIANDPNSTFNYNWAFYQTEGNGPDGKPVKVDSKTLSQQTTAAANAPSSQTAVVGYNAYQLHSYIGQGLMIKSLDNNIQTLQNQYAGKPIPASVQAQIDRLQKAKKATFVFGENTKGTNKSNPNGVCVDDVMDLVENSAPITTSTMHERHKVGMSLYEAAEEEDFPLYQEAMRRAEELTEAFERDKAAGTLRTFAESSTPVSGSYALFLAVPTMTFHGTISISKSSLTVTIATVDSNLPLLFYRLSPSNSGSTLFTEVLNAYASAQYIHQLAQTKTKSALNSQNLLKYMSDRINDAIAKVFG